MRHKGSASSSVTYNKTTGVQEEVPPSTTTTTNRPRNVLITCDLLEPFEFSFVGQFGVHHSLTIHQTPDDETWPGGALWDLGVLLSCLLVAHANDKNPTSTSTTPHYHSPNTSTRKKRQTGTPSTGDTATSKVRMSISNSSSSSRPGLNKVSSLLKNITLPPRVRQVTMDLFKKTSKHNNTPKIVLELGCGVGLSGLVAAAAFSNLSLVVLTDLEVVIDQVTRPNVVRNTTAATASKQQQQRSRVAHSSSSSTSLSAVASRYAVPFSIRTIAKGQTKVVAVPLCWGNENDVKGVKSLLVHHRQQQRTLSSNSTSKKKKGKRRAKFEPKEQRHSKTAESPHRKEGAKPQIGVSTRVVPPSSSPRDDTTDNNYDRLENSFGIPDFMLIGDVAYQHSPGAPSHFDALLATVLSLTDDHTVVLFGTRIRMAASNDLLDLLLEHFDEIVVPPVSAEEVDPSLLIGGVKHNMTIHYLRRSKPTRTNY